MHFLSFLGDIFTLSRPPPIFKFDCGFSTGLSLGHWIVSRLSLGRRFGWNIWFDGVKVFWVGFVLVSIVQKPFLVVNYKLFCFSLEKVVFQMSDFFRKQVPIVSSTHTKTQSRTLNVVRSFSEDFIFIFSSVFILFNLVHFIEVNRSCAIPHFLSVVEVKNDQENSRANKIFRWSCRA